MRNGIIIGALIGIGFGLIGVMVTMHLLNEDTIARESAAHQRGYEAGVERIAGDSIDISEHLNKGMIEESKVLANQVRTVKTQLQALQSRDDLTPQAKEQVAGIIAGLE